MGVEGEAQTAGLGRHAWRWLLQLDKPVPERTDAEITAEMYANYKWNFAVNLGDGAWFWFGSSFISAATILPLFVSKLTTDPFWIALLAVLSQASWYLPQLFTANATERVARKKPVVVNLGFFTERLPLWFLPVAALLCLANPLAALLLFFVAYACHGLGAGAIAPAWSDMFARCFPVEKRGWFFGFTAFVGTGLGAVGAVYSGKLLEAYPYPINFAIVFLIAAVAITISWFFIAMTREPVQRVHDEILRQNGQSWPKIVGIVRGDKNFRNFLLTRLLASLARMGAGFITVAAIYHWQVSDSTVGLYTAALLFGQTAGNLVAGVLADRRGHKLSLEWGLGASTVAFALAWWAPTPEWFYVVFFLTGIVNGMTIVSGVLIVMEFSRAVHRPTYVGIGNTVSGIGMVVAPLIGGVLAIMGYNWLFAASALIGVAALVMLHFSVREPRYQTEFYEVR